MTRRRRASFGRRCWQIASVGMLLYGTAIVVHTVAALAWGAVTGR